MKSPRKTALLLALAMILSSSGNLCALAAEEITLTDDSSSLTIQTASDDLFPSTPDQVAGLTFPKSTDSTITLEWFRTTCTEGYEVARITSSGNYKTIATIPDVATTTYKVTGLTDGTKYRFAVRAYATDSDGTICYGDYSEICSAVTVPRAVTLKTVKYQSQGKIKVSWSKRSRASGYLIQCSTSKTFSNTGRTVTTRVSKSLTSKTVSGLATANYYVRVIPYKTLNGTRYYRTSNSSKKSVKVRSGLTVKQLINRIDSSDNSGKKAIRTLTDNDVNIAKYHTTYDKVMAIYKWHVKHALEFSDCLRCNSNFNDCLYELFGQPTEYNLWIAAGNYINNDGSKAMHKWSVVYLAGVPYWFDPRMQKYVLPSGTTYFAFRRTSTMAKKHYEFEEWYYCTNTYKKY